MIFTKLNINYGVGGNKIQLLWKCYKHSSVGFNYVIII